MTAEPSAADLRAVAVAKLKRAASLPRMKDGRRPPMRDDAVVSEGDKGPPGPDVDPDEREQPSENVTDAETSPPPREPSSTKASSSAAMSTTGVATATEPELEPEPDEHEPPPSGRDTPSKKRRGRSRSRSRSRSRGSKDFREAKAELFRPTDSSPEELPPIPLFAPSLASPIPSHFTNIPVAALFPPRNILASPPPFQHQFARAQATSPPPTLDAIREGLIRSNSARQMAFHKLNGDPVAPTTPTPSTTPPPFGGRTLTRANTVTGVERSAARNLMLKRLEKRAPQKDGDVTSGTDDIDPTTRKQSPPAPASNGTASKRASPAMSNVIDDRDLPGSPSVSPRHTPSPLNHNNNNGNGSVSTHAERKHQETLAKLLGDDPFEFDSQPRRPQPPTYPPQHSILIEDDYIDGPPQLPAGAGQHQQQQYPDHYSQRPQQQQHPLPPRTPKFSEISSTSSMASNTDTERVPLFLQEEGQKSPYAQDTFPVQISPIGTPSRDKDKKSEVEGDSGREGGVSDADEDVIEDNVVYHRHPEEMHARKAYLARFEGKFDPKLSWIGVDDGINLNSVPTPTREEQEQETPDVDADIAPEPITALVEEDVSQQEAEPQQQHEEAATEETRPESPPAQIASVPRLLATPRPDNIRTNSSLPYPQSSEARKSREEGDGYPSSVIPETPSTVDTFGAAESQHAPSDKASEDELVVPHGPTAITSNAAGAVSTRHSNASSSSMVIVDLPPKAASNSNLGVSVRDRGNSDVYTDWEDGQTDIQTDREGLTDHESMPAHAHVYARGNRPERSGSTSRKKRDKEKEKGSGQSRWEKFTAPFTGGRRSRSNSFARPSPRTPTPNPSRESGASAKSDLSGGPAPASTSVSPQPQPHMQPGSGPTLGGTQAQMHSSSASLLSLGANLNNVVPPPRGGLSPIPPISPMAMAMAKYSDPKLNPLPGIERLAAEHRTRTRKLSASAVSDRETANAAAGTVPNTRVNSPEPGLVHQSSDSKIWLRYRSSAEPTAPGEETEYEDGRITPAYIDLVPLSTAAAAAGGGPPRSPTPNGSYSRNPLPQTKEAALRWIQRRKEGKAPSGDMTNGAVSDSGTVRQGGKRKAALSELLASGRGNDSGTERDDRSSMATPRPRSRGRVAVEQLRKLAGSPTDTNAMSFSISSTSSTDKSPPVSAERPSFEESVDASRRINGHVSAASTSSYNSSHLSPSDGPSPTVLTFPTTPPLNLAANANNRPPPSPQHTITTPIKSAMAKPSAPKVAILMQRFNSLVTDAPSADSLGFGSPPRKFIMSSLVRQVISPNEVKNRFLLLFSDILVIAKFHDDDVLEPPLNRRLAVRNIIELRGATVQVPQMRSHDEFMRLPSIRSLVQDFAAGPEEAIARCVQRTALATDPATIANLLFKTSGLDPGALTTYLARRSNRTLLRAYLDRFGFKGMRIDMALRLFLIVIRIPAQDSGVLEHLLTTFASRWFEANKGVVSFDRDLTLRLVLAMMQLNDALHPYQSGSDNGRSPSPSGNRVISREFISAFRMVDAHEMVTDDLLQKVYVSIRNERLVQGLDSSERRNRELPISFGPIPPSLITRTPSEQITIRIPKPDPNFRIQLHGQDLFFDPPTLEFSRSNEASFIVRGSTLGRREMLLVRTGSNAARYPSLPLSCVLSVERPFMPNTFTVAFPTPTSSPSNSKAPPKHRKYRFNVVDEAEHQRWTTELPKMVSALRDQETRSSRGDTTPTSQRHVHLATEGAAIQALREALVVSGEEEGEDDTVAPGRPMQAHTTAKRKPQPAKGTDLIMTCEQNSLIPSVLTFLQATKHGGGGESQSPAVGGGASWSRIALRSDGRI